MIAGLPGTGIGGIFYLFLALWMPMNETIDIIRGFANSEHRQMVKRQLFLTLCVILAVIVTSWLAGWLAIVILSGIHGSASAKSDTAVENFLQVAPIVLTSLTLLAVILAIHGLRLIMRFSRSLNTK